MKLNVIGVVLCILWAPLAKAQYSNWYWYFYNSKINFNAVKPVIERAKLQTLSNGQFVLTDNNGKLKLVASSRNHIFNSKEDIMKGSIDNYANSYSLVDGFPYPGSKDSVVICHDFFDSSRLPSSCQPMSFGYSIVDFTKDSGRGVVIKPNLRIMADVNLVLAIVPHKNNSDYWILYCPDSATLYAYLFDKNGLNSTPVVSKGYFNRYKNQINRCFTGPNRHYVVGNAPMMPTFDHKQLIVTGLNKTIHPTAAALIYDFDNGTGKLSNPVSLFNFSDAPDSSYTTQKAAISWNDTFIYFGVFSSDAYEYHKSSPAYFYQINRFNRNKTLLSTNFLQPPYSAEAGYWATTAAPDGKIYTIDYSQCDGTASKPPILYRVERPNIRGIKSNMKRWVYDTILKMDFMLTLPTSLNRIKPPYFTVNSINNSCLDTSTFNIFLDGTYKKVFFRFGDGDTLGLYGNLSGQKSIKHRYKDDGGYTVTMYTWEVGSDSARLFSDNFGVNKPPYLTKYRISHTPFCGGDTISIAMYAKNHNRFFTNWGIPKPGGGNYDTSIKSGADSMVFKRAFAASNATYPITIGVANDNCGANTISYEKIVSLPFPDKSVFLSNKKLCGGSELALTDSAKMQRQTMVHWFQKTDTLTGNAPFQFQRSVPNAPANYLDTAFVTTSNPYGCIVHDSLTFQVLGSPASSIITGDSVICAAQQYFTANVSYQNNPAGTYWVITDGTDSNHSQNWNKKYTLPGTYTLQSCGYNPNGCRDTVRLGFRVVALPRAGFMLSKDTICQNRNVLQISSTATGNIGKTQYLPGNGDTVKAANIVGYAYKYVGSYRIQQWVTDNENCMDSISHPVLVNTSPGLKIKTNSLLQCVSGNNVQVTDSVVSAGRYTVDFGDGTLANSVPAHHNYALSGKYKISVSILESNACADTAAQLVEIIKNPKADFASPGLCAPDTVTFINKSVPGTNPIVANKWKSENVNYSGFQPGIPIPNAGTIRVQLIVSDTNKCADTIQKNLVVNPKPKPQIQYSGSDFSIQSGFGYNFNCLPDTFSSCIWQIGGSGSLYGARQLRYFSKSDDTQQIHLTVKNAANCEGSSDTTIVVKGLTLYLFPNSFSPNNDGHNDGFGVSGPEYIKTFKLKIFNRWGEMVFYTEDPYEKWEPKQPVPGEYVYKAVVQDIYSRWKEVHGVVVLLR